MENRFRTIMIDYKEGIMKGFFKGLGLIVAIIFATNRIFATYHGALIGLNYWPKLIVVSMLAIIIAGICQYDKNGRRRYNERMFICVSAVLSAITACVFFIEGCDGIITYLDNTLAVTDSPAWSVILAPWVAMFAGAIMCLILAYTGAVIGECRRLSVTRRQKVVR